jgi:hypothetical protein
MAHRIGLIIILVLVSFYAPAGAEICVTKDGGPQTPHDGTCGKKAFSALELQQAIYAAYYAGGGLVKIEQGIVCPGPVTVFPGVGIEGVKGDEPTIMGVIVAGDGTERPCDLHWLKFSNPSGAGVFISGNVNGGVNVTINECIASGSSNYGIAVNPGGYDQPVQIVRTQVSDNLAGGISIRAVTTEVEVRDCQIYENGTGGRGGGYAGGIMAVADWGKPITIRNCAIYDNIAPTGSLGGGVYADGEVEVIDCGIVRNRGGRGGGVLALARSTVVGTTKITNCLIAENESTNRPFTADGPDWWQSTGGGLCCRTDPDAGGKIIVTRCTITKNQTLEGNGGGLAIVGSSVQVTDTRIEANESPGKGGGVSIQQMAQPVNDLGIEFHRCWITGNTAVQGGGGVHYAPVISIDRPFTHVETFLANCLVARNTATTGSGGGVYTESMPIDLISCTIADNAALKGGGVYITDYWQRFGFPQLTFHSSIDNCAITDNLAPEGSAIHYQLDYWIAYFSRPPAPPVIWNCAFLTKDTVSGVVPIPGLNAQGNLWVGSAKYVNRLGGDYHLAAGSRLIDHAHFAHDVGTTDLDLNPRIVGTIDIGCYERPASPPVISVVGAKARRFGGIVTVFLPLTNAGGSAATNVTVSSLAANSATLQNYKPTGNVGTIAVGEQLLIIADFNTSLSVGSRIRVRITGRYDGGTFDVIQYILIQ